MATDYTCSPSVGDCTPDICVIPHEELAEEFVRCGMAAGTLLPAGIPTRSVFNAPVDRAAARRALSLPEEGRHILLMSGSIGCGPMTELARQLDEQLRSGDYATVLCGSTRQMLYALQRRSLLRVQAVGFTSQVAQHMDSADLLVAVADFFTRVHGLKWIAVCGVVEKTVVVIFRGDGSRDIGRLADACFYDVGSAGGHRNLGRAEFPLAAIPAGTKPADFIFQRLHSRKLRPVTASAAPLAENAGQQAVHSETLEPAPVQALAHGA